MQTMPCSEQGFGDHVFLRRDAPLKELKKVIWRIRGSFMPAGGIAIQRKRAVKSAQT